MPSPTRTSSTCSFRFAATTARDLPDQVLAAARDGALILDRLMRTGELPTTVWERPAVMWPPTGTGTAFDPMRTLEVMARKIEEVHEEILAVTADPASTGGESYIAGYFTNDLMLGTTLLKNAGGTDAAPTIAGPGL